MAEERVIDVLTPLGAVFLTGYSTEAVRVATVQGHVRTRGVLQTGKRPVRLLDLESVLSYWKIPLDDPRVDHLKKERGGVLLVGEEGYAPFRYRVLSPPEFEPFFIPEPPHGHRLWFRWD